jgi:hypothetical protein
MVSKHAHLVKLTIEEIVDVLGAKPSGNGWTARCPAHDDTRASLSISEGKGGKVLLHCHAGCDYFSIRNALKHLLRGEKSTRSAPEEPGPARMVAEYDYHDETGAILFQVVRLDPKGFRQRRPDGNGWTWNVKDARRVLYRLPDVLDAVVAGRTVWICEGEKDCDNLVSLGFTVTTNPGGAGKWKPEYSETLRGAKVVILPDADDPGRKHAQCVAAALHGIAAKLKIVEMPVGKDLSEWLEQHSGSKEALITLAKASPDWAPLQTSGLTFTTEKVGSKHRVAVRRGDELLHLDEFNTSSARSRNAFTKAVILKFPDAVARDVDAELLHISEDAGATAPVESTELDLFNICRPEQFFTHEISGLAVAVPCLMDGKPAARYLQLLRWSDGRREERPMAETLDMPDGRKLFLHPTPNEPNIETAKGVWSATSREEWLSGNDSPDVAKLFRNIVGAIKHFVSLPPDRSEGTYATLGLWVWLTYVYRAWETIPYMYTGGPYNSGKTRLFDVLNLLVFRPLPTQNMTAPLLFRSLHDRGGTLLLDEAERLKSPTPDQQELGSMLLAGNHRGGQAMRLEPYGDSFRPVAFDVFGPKALACIAGLPTPLTSRCITILMFRASKDSEKPRRDLDTHPERWQAIRDRLHVVTLEHGKKWLELARRKDVLPSGFSNRDAQLWQPLLAIASFIDESGEPGLLEMMQAHALRTVTEAHDDAVPEADEMLLTILAERVQHGERPTSSELLAEAQNRDGSTFAKWSPRGVSSRLGNYGLKAHKIDNRRIYKNVKPQLLAVQVSYNLPLGIPETPFLPKNRPDRPVTPTPGRSITGDGTRNGTVHGTVHKTKNLAK